MDIKPIALIAGQLILFTVSSALAAEPLFTGSDTCVACHNGVSSAAGEDLSFGFSWRPTMMANAARDPYWQASVRRETLNHPPAAAEIQDECAACHMPMNRYQAKTAGAKGTVFANLVKGPQAPTDAPLAVDGVSCSVCHQISAQKLGAPESFNGGFVVDTDRAWDDRSVFGPFKVTGGLTRIMHSASAFRPVQSAHIQEAEVCASCHTLFTQALGPDGRVVGKLAEQVPYLEWKHSEYTDQMSCQSCHMPEEPEPAPIASVLGPARAGVMRHTFVGGNFFMPRILSRYRVPCGVRALPQELDAAASRVLEHLERAAATVKLDNIKIEGDTLTVDIVVANLAGHKLPTAYPSRRAWLHVSVTDDRATVIFESGALNPDGSIRGNDNDRDGLRFEPHYALIDSPDKVQIYESVMADHGGRVTTALLSGVRYVKDNRLLPEGFDKASAGSEIAPQGDAATDDTFIGGSDRVRYRVHLLRPPQSIRMSAELYYQPIGFRWAINLQAIKADEPQRFVQYYRSMERGSAVVLARAVAEGSPQVAAGDCQPRPAADAKRSN